MGSNFGHIRRWWMKKYKLPTSHDLFQTQTIPELMLEWYEDLYDEKATIDETLRENTAGDEAATLMKRLEAIQDALEVRDAKRTVTGDPLVDFWEAEIRAGREPDLDMQLEDLPDG